MPQKGTSMEVSMSVSEPEGVCEVLPDQPEEEEYMEINHSLEPGILDPAGIPINTVELPTDHDTAPILSVTIQPTTNQQRPQHNRERHSYRSVFTSNLKWHTISYMVHYIILLYFP